MNLLHIMDKYYEIVKRNDVEEAVSRIMNEIGSLERQDKTVAIECMVRLLVIQTKRAELAEAKYESLRRKFDENEARL